MLDHFLIDYFKGNWNVAKKLENTRYTLWKFTSFWKWPKLEWPTIFPIQVLDKEPSCQIWCFSHQVKYFTNYPLHNIVTLEKYKNDVCFCFVHCNLAVGLNFLTLLDKHNIRTFSLWNRLEKIYKDLHFYLFL